VIALSVAKSSDLVRVWVAAALATIRAAAGRWRSLDGALPRGMTRKEGDPLTRAAEQGTLRGMTQKSGEVGD
ncbi:MAG: hypothetical protein NC218_12205, partial [Acetobacter sp.]|nr:hypothetical protein [Acetobacter sp.]